ncbi:MAG: hypothetical protein AAFY80_01430 [Pseudomonadota bacterium]
MVEIVDRASARAWLEGKPREVQVAFAARAALRALPGITQHDEGTIEEIVLPLCRAIFISATAAIETTDNLVKAAESAAVRADMAVDIADVEDDVAEEEGRPAWSASKAAYSAIVSVFSAHSGSRLAYGITESTRTAVRSDVARDLFAAAWRAIDLDADSLGSGDSPNQVFRYALWRDAVLPEGLETGLTALRAFWSRDPSTWDFWARWYEGMLTGNPLPWDLQEVVALIDDEDWEAGPERVAERIREIEARYIANTLKEEVTFSASGRLTLIATPVNRSGLLGQLLDTVEDAVDLTLSAPRNELTEESHQIRIIRNALNRYANDAQRLEMDFERAKALQLTDIANEALPPSAANNDLAQTLADAAGALRDSDRDIARNRETLNRIRLAQLSDKDGQKIAAVAVEVANASEGTLREDLLEDRYRLPGVRRADGVPDPIVPMGAPERNAGLEAADAQLRIASRLTKVWGFLRDKKEDIGLAGSIASIIALIIAFVF